MKESAVFNAALHARAQRKG